MRPGERPVVCIGQDEATFKQHVFTAKVWQYEGRRRRLLPKDEGLGVKVSAFVHGVRFAHPTLLLVENLAGRVIVSW